MARDQEEPEVSIDPHVTVPRIEDMRLKITALLICLATPVLPAPVIAEETRVTDRAAFVGLVSGKRLTSLGVSLNVSPSGAITGRAFGRDVTGSWSWNNGYFCRTMQAGDKTFAFNCQLVEKNGSRLRFTADKGKGATADLRIR